MSKEYWQAKRIDSEQAIDRLTKQMENAGVASKGDYQNQIEKRILDLEYYKEKEDICSPESSPANVQIFIYVIATTKNKVLETIGPELFVKVEEDRYHETIINKWKPFYQEEPIYEILNKLKGHYPFQEYYLDEDHELNHSNRIDENPQNSIGIIDLLSVNEKNETLVRCFDSIHVAGVLIPHCIHIKPELSEYIIKKRENILSKLNKRKSSWDPCLTFFFDISEHDNFRMLLLQVLKNKFPIRNQTTSNNKIRGINISIK